MDIVERLRQPVMLHSSAEHTNAERREAAAEIERLLAALKEIADMPPLIQYAGVEGKPIVYDAEQRIARKALSNEQNENGNG